LRALLTCEHTGLQRVVLLENKISRHDLAMLIDLATKIARELDVVVVLTARQDAADEEVEEKLADLLGVSSVTAADTASRVPAKWASIGKRSVTSNGGRYWLLVMCGCVCCW
jgi:predicted TIM-barrel fold metal-dependent hydrolase